MGKIFCKETFLLSENKKKMSKCLVHKKKKESSHSSINLF
jgi:hypothetical protein